MDKNEASIKQILQGSGINILNDEYFGPLLRAARICAKKKRPSLRCNEGRQTLSQLATPNREETMSSTDLAGNPVHTEFAADSDPRPLPWIGIRTGILVHTKTRRLLRYLRAYPRWAVRGLPAQLLLWAARDYPSGQFRGCSEEDLEDFFDWEGEPGELVSAFKRSGYLSQDETGTWGIVDWQQYQGAILRKRNLDARRQQGERAKIKTATKSDLSTCSGESLEQSKSKSKSERALKQASCASYKNDWLSGVESTSIEEEPTAPTGLEDQPTEPTDLEELDGDLETESTDLVDLYGSDAAPYLGAPTTGQLAGLAQIISETGLTRDVWLACCRYAGERARKNPWRYALTRAADVLGRERIPRHRVPQQRAGRPQRPAQPKLGSSVDRGASIEQEGRDAGLGGVLDSDTRDRLRSLDGESHVGRELGAYAAQADRPTWRGAVDWITAQRRADSARALAALGQRFGFSLAV